MERKQPKVARLDVGVCIVSFPTLMRELPVRPGEMLFEFYLKYLYWDDCAGDGKHKMPRFTPQVSACILLQCLRRSLRWQHNPGLGRKYH